MVSTGVVEAQVPPALSGEDGGGASNAVESLSENASSSEGQGSAIQPGEESSALSAAEAERGGYCTQGCLGDATLFQNDLVAGFREQVPGMPTAPWGVQA